MLDGQPGFVVSGALLDLPLSSDSLLLSVTNAYTSRCEADEKKKTSISQVHGHVPGGFLGLSQADLRTVS